MQTVNLTVDIWSDHKMHAFLGVTSHFITFGVDGCLKLQSVLLNCHRFSGSHTGDRIASEFESILDIYQIKQKVDHVITDNAANMKSAMTPSFIYDFADDTGDDDRGDFVVTVELMNLICGKVCPMMIRLKWST